MTRLNLTFAAQNYDRLAPLHDGRVEPEGIILNFLRLPVEETFFRQTHYAEFDVSEMSLSTYVLSLQDPDPAFTALPVFPSRYFRHQSIFVNRHSGVREPADLKGKTVGVPEYQITAAVWQRGILGDDYGIHPTHMRWRRGGVEQPGRIEKVELDLPSDLVMDSIGPEETLAGQLARGEIDALFSAHEPSVFASEEHVVRLFPRYRQTEQDYFSRTRIFPIMHVVVVRRSILDAHPWVARSLYKAFDAARAQALDDLQYRSALMVMLPWLAEHVEQTSRLMGRDFWTYGLEPNRAVLETFLRYSHEQGLSHRQYDPEELFAEPTLTTYAI